MKKIKVLWFTNTPSLYDQGRHHYHGGGWIESLEELITSQSEIELGIAFFHPTDNIKVIRDDVSYYPIKYTSIRKKPITAVFNNWTGRFNDKEYFESFLKIIDDYKPDVIQVFGTENAFGMVHKATNIPVIIHLQGILNPYENSYLPVGFSQLDFVINLKYLTRNIFGISPVFGLKRFRLQALREKKILEVINYVCGRTEWDFQIASLYNPKITYYHLDEVLRPIFYQNKSLKTQNNGSKFIILSTLSPTIYKGIDVVLKTAKKLCEICDFDFEWRIIGLEANADLLTFFESKTGINHKDFRIKLVGKLNPLEIVKEMNSAEVFVHPSYIDNSPNSLCEAQMLGLPVIACDVGGVSSLIKHKENGLLVPSNGVYEIVYYLRLLFNEADLRAQLGAQAQITANQRHDKEKITSSLLRIYKNLVLNRCKD